MNSWVICNIAFNILDSLQAFADVFFLFQIYVFFPKEEKVGIKTLEIYTTRMKTENVCRAILVVQQNLSPFARKHIFENASKFHLEVFRVNIICNWTCEQNHLIYLISCLFINILNGHINLFSIFKVKGSWIQRVRWDCISKPIKSQFRFGIGSLIWFVN